MTSDARGGNTKGLNPDNIDRLQAECAAVGVVLHYSDWEHKSTAEAAFRNRDADVMVATSTVAAGVNLPARGVIVRDTRVGLDEINIATIQQMFGRAGRISAGETEGFAYLLTTENTRALWQQRLTTGYTVASRIHDFEHEC